MTTISRLVLGLAVVCCGDVCVAQEQGHHTTNAHSMVHAVQPDDARQAVAFPPAMRQHTLANMRDHLATLSDILTALSQRQYMLASTLAEQRLGLSSPSAQGCRPQTRTGATSMSLPASPDHQIAQLMPEGMRELGAAMHHAASEFSTQAAKASRTGNAKPAMKALARMTQQCTACHAVYSLQ